MGSDMSPLCGVFFLRVFFHRKILLLNMSLLRLPQLCLHVRPSQPGDPAHWSGPKGATALRVAVCRSGSVCDPWRPPPRLLADQLTDECCCSYREPQEGVQVSKHGCALTTLVSSETRKNKVHLYKLSQQDERQFPTLREISCLRKAS